MQKVYVQNKRERALMPMKPAVARHLLDAGRAAVVNVCPFTIRLNYATGENRQEVIVGLDTGPVTSSITLKGEASNDMIAQIVSFVVPASTTGLAAGKTCRRGPMSTGVKIPASPAVSFK